MSPVKGRLPTLQEILSSIRYALVCFVVMVDQEKATFYKTNLFTFLVRKKSSHNKLKQSKQFLVKVKKNPAKIKRPWQKKKLWKMKLSK